MDATSAILWTRGALSDRADPARAPQMQAYMKCEMPFLGVAAPARKEVLRDLGKQFKPTDAEAYRAFVLGMWRSPHREERYLAVDAAVRWKKFIRPSALPMYETMIREGAWWDFVDRIAAHLVGGVLLSARSTTQPILDVWLADDELWIRRAAVLAHLRHKAHTDVDVLFRACIHCAHETTFWMRKAIGWALREYAKTDPRAVRNFLAEHEHRFAPLTLREARKHIGP